MEKSGVILLNKAPLENSTSAVNKVRRAVGADKAGHLGTLDSLGAGVLPIAVGKATSVFGLFLKKKKIYRAIFKFGVETTTFDADGEIVSKSNKIVSKETVCEHIRTLTGKLEQLPPNFSAKKIGGIRASDIVRNGETVELKKCNIEIFRFDLVSELEQNLFLFEIECSAGTYIRSLCRDLGVLCGMPATMVCIIRTKCGKFNIENTFTLEQIQNGNYEIVPLLEIFDEKEIEIDEQTRRSIVDGKKTHISLPNGEYKLVFGGKLFVLAHVIDEMVFVDTFFGEK